MASIFDVMDALQGLILAATHPNGTAPGQLSILGPDNVVAVAQGWPLAKDLDSLDASKRTLVSIYAVPSSTSDTDQPFNMLDPVVVPPDTGLTITTTEAGFTLTGTPKVGEYVTVETGRGQTFSEVAVQGSTAASLAAALAADIAAKYPQTVANGATVTISPTPNALAVRGGGIATMGRRTHRQRTQFRISVWAYEPRRRARVASAIDVALKSQNVIRIPADQTQALIVYMGTNLDDKFETEGVYRADLMFNVTYDTLETYPAYPVTTVSAPVDPFAPL